MTDTSEVEEVRYIAEGRSREDIEARAKQAYDWANECRARYASLLDMSKRGSAVVRAVAWADITAYLDDTGAPAFSREAYDEWRTPGARERAFAWLRWLNLPWWVLIMKAFFGTSPIDWRETVR